MSSFDLPKKVQVSSPKTPPVSQADLSKLVHEELNRKKRIIQKIETDRNGLSIYDLTDSMRKRRIQAILNTVQEICRRFQAPAELQSYYAQAWCELNLPYITYSQMDVSTHILFAAAIWVLDQVMPRENWRELFFLLPKDDSVIEELCLHDVWDSQYDYDLILSVEYVLHFRNPLEIDGAGNSRTLTSNWLARRSTEKRRLNKPPKEEERSQKELEQDRKNYEAMIALIPQEAIDQAVEHFRESVWQWTDRYFQHIEPLIQSIADSEDAVRETQIRFNRAVDEFNQAVVKAEKTRKRKPYPRATERNTGPLLNRPDTFPNLSPSRDASLLSFSGRPGQLALPGLPMSYDDAALDDMLKEVYAAGQRFDDVEAELDERYDASNKAYSRLAYYSLHMSREGRISKDVPQGQSELGKSLTPMEPMRFENPYELCFALLYLMEQDDDLAWLYGVGCGLMNEVTESLPWGIFEYDELEDNIWFSEDGREESVTLPKSITIPDVYERRYRTKNRGDFDFPRSLAQILYEETGCLLPRNLHRYDSQSKLLGRYGIKGKNAAAMLMLMNTMGTVRRNRDALNLKGHLDDLLWIEEQRKGETAEQPEEAGQTEPEASITPEELKALREELKRLKTALHAADRENRETKKAMANLKNMEERERRELADLRAYVFHQEQGEEDPQQSVAGEAKEWPYEVRRDTVVFGGHATWLKGIKSILTGNIRFIDKDLVFDTGLIKHADIIWVQPNALSHPMYWRVVDTAKAHKKPVRYFSFASWTKCARQVMEGDR